MPRERTSVLRRGEYGRLANDARLVGEGSRRHGAIYPEARIGSAEDHNWRQRGKLSSLSSCSSTYIREVARQPLQGADALGIDPPASSRASWLRCRFHLRHHVRIHVKAT